ncbi:MAG: SufS family cysteine desulfurase [Paludibacteraceae bacterium]|nr:SufS family cysteine desulfurase [Paludibacteraceae bacterium]
MNKSDFPILKEQIHGKPLVYLDNAATTQKPQVVIDAISYAYSHFNANIHRGVHHLSQVATAEHEHARQLTANFIGAGSAKEIVFSKGTTDSINMLAWSLGEWKYNGQYVLKEGEEIIVSRVEHHSNIVPWQMLCERRGLKLKVIPLNDDLTLDIEAFKKLLSNRTRVVSIAHVSNVLGIINPIEEIIKLSHQAGALVCVDAAQSAPHLPIDVGALDCDFLVFSAHKIYGPTGLGVLYGKESLLSNIPPAEGGGEMIEHVSFEKTTYNTLPYKFEAGTPDFIGSYAFGKAIEYIQKTGLENIHRYETDLVGKLEESLLEAKLGSCTIKIYGQGQKKAGVISFNLFDSNNRLVHPYDIGTLLDQQGVAVRTGHHCAEPLINTLGVPGTIRASLALYNDENDVNQMIKALEKAAQMLC